MNLLDSISTRAGPRARPATTRVPSPVPHGRRARSRLRGTLPGLVLLGLGGLLAPLAGCGGTQAPPAPGDSRGFPPDLRNRRVILLPVQENLGVRGDVDAEIRFAFSDFGGEVEWVFADEVQEILDRTPGMDTRTRGLAVSLFQSAEVERIGDPLYGELRRMSALVEADVILIPLTATFEPNEALADDAPRVRLSATLVEPRTGRVLWYGIEEGGDYPQGDPRALASAVEALAQTVFWYAGPLEG